MPPPPPPAKRPGLAKVEVVKALSDYRAQADGELSFAEGDTIYVLDKGDPHYKCKTSDNREGLVPASYFTDKENVAQQDYPLHEAAKRGNLGFVQELLKMGMSPNGLDRAGNSALYWAARGGHTECVQALLRHAPVLRQQNKLGDTVLHGAAWGGRESALQALLSAPGIEEVLGVRNNAGQTAFELAKTVECGALLQRRQMNVAQMQQAMTAGADDDQLSD